MQWAFRVARIAGIDVHVHATFGLVLTLAAVQWGVHHGLSGALFGASVTAMLLASIALHELAHVATAHLLGVPVRVLVLWPIGGVARFAGQRRRVRDELLIAFAGPAFSALLATVLFRAAGPALPATDGLSGLGALAAGAPSLQTALAWLIAANLGLAALNLIPALPFDGGRALRAGLTTLLGGQLAASAASYAGQAIAVILFLLGAFTGHLVLTFASVLVFWEAAGQRTWEPSAEVPGGPLSAPGSGARDAHLAPDDRVRRAALLMLTSRQPDFPVICDGEVVGIVTRSDVLRALAGGTGDVRVASVMRRDVPRVDADASFDEVGRMMVERNTPVVAVFDGQRYLGLVKHSDIARALTPPRRTLVQRARRTAPSLGVEQLWT